MSVPFFFAKLIPPPRASADDLGDAERALLLAHQDYWLPRLNAGAVVALGSVRDVSGLFGVMIVNADSAETLAAWQAGDPAILAGAGFTYETAPMSALRLAPGEPLAPVHSISP